MVYLLFLICLLELWARGYFLLRRHVPFWALPRELVFMWYPGLKELERYDGGRFSVLVLGGSALTKEWGNVPACLKSELEKAVARDVVLVNLASPAHGSLDSLYKYGWISGRKFDLVIFYHGINETRANNVPPDFWKDDYSHYSWYREINFYFRHARLMKQPLLLPYFIEHLLVQLDREVLKKDKYVPTHSPREDWLEYGKDIKTRETFKKNVKKIIELAAERGEKLLVMTYAYYEPGPDDDESSVYRTSVKLWGKLGSVVTGMEEHNKAIEKLAADGGFIFLDQEKLLGGKKEYFTDICHLSDEGSEVFSKNIAERIK